MSSHEEKMIAHEEMMKKERVEWVMDQIEQRKGSEARFVAVRGLLTAHSDELEKHRKRLNRYNGELLAEHRNTLNKHQRLSKHCETVAAHRNSLNNCDNLATQDLAGYSDLVAGYCDLVAAHGQRIDEHGDNLAAHGQLLYKHGDSLANYSETLASHCTTIKLSESNRLKLNQFAHELFSRSKATFPAPRFVPESDRNQFSSNHTLNAAFADLSDAMKISEANGLMLNQHAQELFGPQTHPEAHRS